MIENQQKHWAQKVHEIGALLWRFWDSLPKVLLAAVCGFFLAHYIDYGDSEDILFFLRQDLSALGAIVFVILVSLIFSPMAAEVTSLLKKAKSQIEDSFSEEGLSRSAGSLREKEKLKSGSKGVGEEELNQLEKEFDLSVGRFLGGEFSGRMLALSAERTIDEEGRSLLGIDPIETSSQPAVRTHLPSEGGAHDETMRFVRLYFVTNRCFAVKSSGKKDFAVEEKRKKSSELVFGEVHVRVPKHHKFGHVEVPGKVAGKFLWLFEKINLDQRFRMKYFTMVQIEEFTKDNFVAALSKEASKNTAFVFVHGFNNNFFDGLMHLAQLRWDLQHFDVPFVLFSWPSVAATDGYVHDRDMAEVSSAKFQECLDVLWRAVGIKNIVILAHSMGSHLAVLAFEKESLRRVNAPQGTKVSSFVMAAPDVSKVKFEDVSSHVLEIAEQVTCYASNSDLALDLSKIVGMQERVGQVKDGEPCVLVDGIESIDASMVSFWTKGKGHSYHQSSIELMNDLSSIISSVKIPSKILPPHERSSKVRRVPEPPMPTRFWRIAP